MGSKIFELRKNAGISQEQLGERIGVTRQTISNWELGETAPNTEQLKLLSKEFNVSIDEMLDNDIRSGIEGKVSNTEKLAGLVLNILKVMGIVFALLLVIDFISLILFTCFRGKNITSNIKGVELNCIMDDKAYIITVGSDGYFNCSIDLQRKLKDNYIDFGNIEKTGNDIGQFFKDNNGKCD